MAEPVRGLRELELRPGYDSGDDALSKFYVPALERAVDYRRSAGYFRSSSLSVAARGLSRFIAGGGRMKLLVGTDLTREDCDAIVGGTPIPESLAQRLSDDLVPEDDLERYRLEVLAWLVRERRLMVRIAYPVDDHGGPVAGQAGYFHEKLGVLRDSAGDGVAFVGSNNETAAAWTRNFESFAAFTSWDDWRQFDHWSTGFDRRWAGRVPGWKVVDLPQAVRDRLISYSPPEAPQPRDPEEPPQLGPPHTVAAWLRAAPTLVGADDLAESTAGVVPFPHQRQVVERLAGEYPRSWLLADEVGLGKTISAGLALRRLLLTKQVRRVLILAPANVCRQWQDELFEKFGLWVDRLDGNWWRRPHPGDDAERHVDDNPYGERDILIASSHLARRADHQQLVLDAGPWDLVIVDEAHHARRKRESDPARYRPGRLLELLDRITDSGVARATWLLTATPMQVDAIELHDLLRHVDLVGELGKPDVFERWYALLGGEPAAEALQWFNDTLFRSPSPPLGVAEHAFLSGIGDRLGPVQREIISRFGTAESTDVATSLSHLTAEGRSALIDWLRLRGPVGRCVTRHSRTTLKAYRAAGLLKEPLADRDVEPVMIRFTPEEQRLYKELDLLIDRLLEAHGTRKGAGFVLTVYRRRLTSSWSAIEATLERRLLRDPPLVDIGDDLSEEADEDDIPEGPDDTVAVPLSDADIADVRRFIDDINNLPTDSKFDQLRRDLDDARSTGHASIVFTQFTDTLLGLRDRLKGVYTTELATFTGDGGRRWDPLHGWTPVSKQELIESVRSGDVTVLLANDAASEGLNLQTCSYLVNYDMPWNPMRAEQRIGRIDRIGQTTPVIQVRNYFIPGTVEERVYELLADRIDNFSDLLGDLQPILGATEAAFRKVFRSPRSERDGIVRDELEELDDRIAELRDGGVRLDVEDPLPVPNVTEPTLDLERLSELLDHCGVRLGYRDRPVTFDRDGASRDSEDWRALATFGHPDLDDALRRIAEGHDTDPLVVETAELQPDVVATVALRADRTPPEAADVTALGELSEPVSTGDARHTAADEARTAALQRLEHLRATVMARVANRERSVEDRFVRLVHRLVAAEIARGRLDGDERDPLGVWLDLRRDTATGWSFAGMFAEKLKLDAEILAPGRLAEKDAAARSDVQGLHRHSGFRELEAIMQEWKALQDDIDRGRAT